LPEGTDAVLLEGHVQSGRYVLFFPPTSLSSTEFKGVHWDGWKELVEPASIDNWRGDQDLLQNTQNGSALPVGELRVKGLAVLQGEYTRLATVSGGLPLLARIATERGGVYFCTTRPDEGASSLASNGIVLYVMLQRALAFGSESLTSTRHVVAGSRWSEEARQWRRLAGDFSLPSDQYGLHAGVYQLDDQWLAVNRDPLEDAPTVVGDQRLAELFEGLEFIRVDDHAGTWQALVEEIWRVFVIGMIAAMIGEAILCLPRLRMGETTSRSVSGFGTAEVSR
jgi:hypothetical protein